MKTTEQKISEFVNWVNETFKPYDVAMPVAKDKTRITKHAIITSESSAFYPKEDEFSLPLPVIDYYGEYRGGYPWIEPRIEKKAEEMGLLLEWQNPSYIIIVEA